MDCLKIHRNIRVRVQPMIQNGVATFVQVTVVQGDLGRSGQIVQGTVIRGDFGPRRILSKEAFTIDNLAQIIFGQSGARAPISDFFCLSFCLSLLAYGEVLRIVGGMGTF